MPFLVSLKRVLEFADPTEFPPWNCLGGPTLNDVKCAVDQEDFLMTPVPDEFQHDPKAHARRIAWLVINGWDDAINIDVGIPSWNYAPEWPILDGNHRLFAAAFRNDGSILLSVDGDLGYAAEIFGVSIENLEEGEYVQDAETSG